jgi:predicted PurR-regulated permease PerM
VTGVLRARRQDRYPPPFVAALVTILTITFFLILDGERYLSAGVGLFAETHRPLATLAHAVGRGGHQLR